MVYNKAGTFKITAVDSGIKFNQIRLLCQKGACVTVVPWNYKIDSDGKNVMMYRKLKCFEICNKLV